MGQTNSVNGAGGGQTTAALHALASKYTVVLIDGQRMAGFSLNSGLGGGSAVNLESIPLEAIERVEVLTDGASALYGADAVAGVVNFILKKNSTEGNVFYHATVPEQQNGGGWSAGFSKGFGDLGSDGYNLLVTYSHDVQDRPLGVLIATFRGRAESSTSRPAVATTCSTPAPPTRSRATSSCRAESARSIPTTSANGNCGNANAAVLILPPNADRQHHLPLQLRGDGAGHCAVQARQRTDQGHIQRRREQPALDRRGRVAVRPDLAVRAAGAAAGPQPDPAPDAVERLRRSVPGR